MEREKQQLAREQVVEVVSHAEMRWEGHLSTSIL